MKIATWNLKRPAANSRSSESVRHQLARVDADILVLTETHLSARPVGDYFSCHSSALGDQTYYAEGERRVSLYSRYRVSRFHKVYDHETVLCAELATPLGPLLVYGTVLGILGNRRRCFKEHLRCQVQDFTRLSELGPLCVAGDLNQSFSDNYYFTREGRELLSTAFSDLGLSNLTASLPANIDHIVIQEEFVGGRPYSVSSWNADKSLSDHIGVAVEIDDGSHPGWDPQAWQAPDD